MGWVVKSLRGEALAAAGASALARDAERDARRIRRGAARDAGQVLAALATLETLGLETRDRVRAERRRLRAPAMTAVRTAEGAGETTGRELPATPAGAAGRTTATGPSPAVAVPAVRRTASAPAPAIAARSVAPLVRAAEPTRRRRRASLRESPVVELFRRT